VVDEDYLLVPDYNQKIIYQMMPQSGDLRALPMDPCKPVYLVFDPKIDGVYVTCHTEDHFEIQRKTFDDRINQVIYLASEGSLHWHKPTACLMCRNCRHLNIPMPLNNNNNNNNNRMRKFA